MTSTTNYWRDVTTPTVLLVQGEFTSAYSWAATIEAMRQICGGLVELIAIPNPMCGLSPDADYVKAAIAAVDRPVLLVGHGYGGAVITVAGAEADNVAGLVYVAAFALDETEACIDVIGRAGDTRFAHALVPLTLPIAGAPTIAILLKRRAFEDIFAADLSPDVAAAAAASQHPITAVAQEERPRSVAWRHLPCWYLIATADRLLGVDAPRSMAKRAKASAVEVNASHAVPSSAPAVAQVIYTAIRGERSETTAVTGRPPRASGGTTDGHELRLGHATVRPRAQPLQTVLVDGSTSKPLRYEWPVYTRA